MRRLVVRSGLVISAALLGTVVACQRTSAEPDASALLSEPFFLRGTITEVGQPGGYRMRGEPGTDYRVNEAYFRVESGTELRRADGTRASVADLVVGRELTLWITGPIAESYPVQVRAQRVVLK